MHEVHGIRLFDEVEESILSGRILEPELMEASVDGRKISAHRHLKIVPRCQKIEGVEKMGLSGSPNDFLGSFGAMQRARVFPFAA